MTTKKPLFKLLCVSALTLLSVAAGFNAQADECKPKHTIKTVTPGTLTVTSVIIPPFIFKGENDAFTGIDVDILREFAKENCLKVNHVITDSAAAIQYVVASRSDVAVGAWYRTAERAKVLGITSPVYLEQAAIYSRDGATKFEQLKGRKVGTVQGYLWVPELKKLYGSDLSLYPNAVGLAQDISTGRIEAAVNTYSIGAEAQRQGGLSKDLQIKVVEPDERVKSSVYPAQSGFLYTKGNAQLGAGLDDTIKQMKDNGAIAGLLTKYGLDASAADTGAPRYADE
ncbi:substrate-binding periplasmic protein [Pseudomonas mandelii]|uniref:substrate-binding periplasmic protein n=1 Tax=Pseudomonas mandelii TaxID=75612 RepID=UPI00035C402A|nr:transporter substrate-binding domain-containing protein [Pseudomonas mandelii]